MRLLIAAGRVPNIEALDLAAAGVAFTRDGVVVDDGLRTSNRRIFAAGDVCSRFKFTHAADALARIVIRNALFFGRARASALVIPWCTYTDPELAHVGAYEAEAARADAVSRPSPSRSPTSIAPWSTRNATASCACTTSAAACWGARSSPHGPAR